MDQREDQAGSRPDDGLINLRPPKHHASPSNFQVLPTCSSQRCTSRSLAQPITTKFPSLKSAKEVSSCVAITRVSSAWNNRKAYAIRRAEESSGDGAKEGTSNVSGAGLDKIA